MARRTFFLIRLLLPAVLLLALYWFLVGFLSSKGIPVAQSKAQFYFFPAVILYFVYLNKSICEIPKKLYFLVVVSGVIFTGFSRTTNITHSPHVLFAPLKGDKLASKARQIKAEFQSALGKNKKNHAQSIYEQVDTQEAAQSILKKNTEALALVWGDNKNLRITISNSAKFVSLPNAQWLHELTNYKVITHIPYFSSGLEPLTQTIKVITASLVGDHIDMLVAAKIVARWRTTTTRSFLFFRIANAYLLESLDANEYQYTPLDCAIDYYNRALKTLKTSDSPELRRAILNNLSLALYIRGLAEAGKEDLRRSRQYILFATREPRKKTTKISSIIIARENAKIIASFVKNGGLERK